MGAQRLSDKNTAKWAHRLDLPLRRMWSFGGYTFAIVTDDHRHGWVDSKTGEVEWDEAPGHFTSCFDELWPDEAPWAREPV